MVDGEGGERMTERGGDVERRGSTQRAGVERAAGRRVGLCRYGSGKWVEGQ